LSLVDNEVVALAMSSRSRRKTLSHTEIESFLNDISVDDSHQNARKRRTTLLSNDFNIENYDINIVEDTHMVAASKDLARKDDDDQNSNLVVQTTTTSNLDTDSIAQINVERELVREYCRVSYLYCVSYLL
jgi:hypothetical protein